MRDRCRRGLRRAGRWCRQARSQGSLLQNRTRNVPGEEVAVVFRDCGDVAQIFNRVVREIICRAYRLLRFPVVGGGGGEEISDGLPVGDARR